MGFFDKFVKEITRPVKKVFKTELNRVIGDVKGEISRSPELRAGLVAGGQLIGIPAPVTAAAVSSLRRPEEPKKGAIPSPILTGPGITPGAETPAVEGSIESWAWTNKYLQAQRQVAQAKSIEVKPTKAAATLSIEELALPAVGIGLAWWLFGG